MIFLDTCALLYNAFEKGSLSPAAAQKIGESDGFLISSISIWEIWIKIKKGANLSLDDLVRYAKRKIDKTKSPHHFKLVKEFPMTRSGKVQKFKLAEMAKKEYGL